MRIAKSSISCNKELGDYMSFDRARVLYDSEEQLLAIHGDDNGPYAIDKEMFRIKIRRIPKEIKLGRYEAWWDDERGMIIADLRKPVTIS